MSYCYSDTDSSPKRCNWCTRQTDKIEKSEFCDHYLCNKCIIRETKCQSKCPVCWTKNIDEYLKYNRICSVCVTAIKAAEEPRSCPKSHLNCSKCSSKGCILCRFHELGAYFDKISRDLSPNDQQVFLTCATWENIHEKAHSKHLISMQNDKISEQSQAKKIRQDDHENSDCVICCERLGSSYRTLERCKHCFHHSCIDQWFQSNGKQSCPTCGYVYGISKGPQPPNGKMILKYIQVTLPGYEHEQVVSHKGPTIEVTYIIPSGIQGPLNPHPGHPYSGTIRKAYLPNTKEGNEILALLKQAFDDQHVFTIGTSSTTGQDNVVTWNDIHHKTSIGGGPQRFGYPDPTYLLRIRQELADKGYK